MHSQSGIELMVARLGGWNNVSQYINLPHKGANTQGQQSGKEKGARAAKKEAQTRSEPKKMTWIENANNQAANKG